MNTKTRVSPVIWQIYLEFEVWTGDFERAKGLLYCTMCQNSYWARIKPTALLSAFDKENLIEFSFDSLHYLYIMVAMYYIPIVLMLFPSCDILWLWHVTWPFVTLWQSHVISFPCSILSNKSNKEKKKKRNINDNLAIFAKSWYHPLLSFLIPRNFPTTHSMGQSCCPFHHFSSVYSFTPKSSCSISSSSLTVSNVLLLLTFLPFHCLQFLSNLP